ncbi:hypothetical protein AAH979_10455 [Plantactinospora sp. ZYX-F-223]|uniref:hypothetical protein n=1 Tax=Plantactinospora sp. ZYX-F-223 TaxID=3144103 RepID=UPI0031FCCC64
MSVSSAGCPADPAADAPPRRGARRLDIRVIEVDGSRDAEGVADLVAAHFAPFLP